MGPQNDREYKYMISTASEALTSQLASMQTQLLKIRADKYSTESAKKGNTASGKTKVYIKFRTALSFGQPFFLIWILSLDYMPLTYPHCL